MRFFIGFGFIVGLGFARTALSAVPAAPIDQPDVFGGYVSTYVLIKVKSGGAAVQLPDGRWTIQRAGNAADDQPGIEEAKQIAAQSQALATVLQNRGAQRVVGAFRVPPANAQLARHVGLDRHFLIEFPAGSNTPAIANDVRGFDALFESVEIDRVGGVARIIPDDPSFPMQYGMHNTGQTGGTPDADVDAPECWLIHQGSSAVTLAIIDTGVQQFDPKIKGSSDHPELAGRVIGGFNTWDNNDDTNDPQGHGTHVAGIAGATGNNAIGVAGLNWNVTILAMRCTSTTGSSNETVTANAVTWAVDNGADVLNLSLQFNAGTTILRDAVAYAYDSGVLPIAAAGNMVGFIYPGAFPKCMAISASNRFDTLWLQSNTGPHIDVAAPGHQIFSLSNNSGYSTISGTSMSAPHVSGLVATLLARDPALTPQQLEQIIRTTADDRGAPGFDEQFGWGRLNAYAAVQAAATCPGDVAAPFAIVNVNDLLLLIGNWGATGGNLADITGDQVVNVNDLLAIVGTWGPCE